MRILKKLHEVVVQAAGAVADEDSIALERRGPALLAAVPCFHEELQRSLEEFQRPRRSKLPGPDLTSILPQASMRR